MLTVGLASELVMLGYMVLLWDTLHWCQRDQTHRDRRDRGVFGATLDGGLRVARPSRVIQGPTESLDGVGLAREGGDQFSLRMIGGMQGEVDRIQDEYSVLLDQFERSDEEEQE